MHTMKNVHARTVFRVPVRLSFWGADEKNPRAIISIFDDIFAREIGARTLAFYRRGWHVETRASVCARDRTGRARARPRGTRATRVDRARARENPARARGREICVRDREKTPVKYAGGRRQAAPHVPLFRAGERRAVHLTNTISAKKAETGEGRALPIVLSSRLYTYNARFTQ